MAETKIYAIGQGRNTFAEFVGHLKAKGINTIVDVRSYPSSSNGDFNRRLFATKLANAGINYVFKGRELGDRPESYDMYEDGNKTNAVIYSKVMESPQYMDAITDVVDLAKTPGNTVALFYQQGSPTNTYVSMMLGQTLEALPDVEMEYLLGGDSFTHKKIIETSLGYGEMAKTALAEAGGDYLKLRFMSDGRYSVGSETYGEKSRKEYEQKVGKLKFIGGLKPNLTELRYSNYHKSLKAAAEHAEFVISFRHGTIDDYSTVDYGEEYLFLDHMPHKYISINVSRDAGDYVARDYAHQVAEQIRNTIIERKSISVTDSWKEHFAEDAARAFVMNVGGGHVFLKNGEVNANGFAVPARDEKTIGECAYMYAEGALAAEVLTSLDGAPYWKKDGTLSAKGEALLQVLTGDDFDAIMKVSVKLDKSLEKEGIVFNMASKKLDYLIEGIRQNDTLLQGLLVTDPEQLSNLKNEEGFSHAYVKMLETINAEEQDRFHYTSRFMITGSSLDILSKFDISQEYVDTFISNVYEELDAMGIKAEVLVSNGQTGFAEAAVKSDLMHGHVPEVYMPRNGRFRYPTSNGDLEFAYRDINDPATSILRFAENGRNAILLNEAANKKQEDPEAFTLEELTDGIGLGKNTANHVVMNHGRSDNGLSTGQLVALSMLGIENGTLLKLNNLLVKEERSFKTMAELHAFVTGDEYFDEGFSNCTLFDFERYEEKANELVRDSLQQDIYAISINDVDYPENLRNVRSDVDDDSVNIPVILWAKGDSSVLNTFSAAVLGARTRVASAGGYGVRNDASEVMDIARQAASTGAAVLVPVQGDTAALAISSAIAENGVVIGITSTSLDDEHLGPQKERIDDIINTGGVVISEQPLGKTKRNGKWVESNLLHYNAVASERIVTGACNFAFIVSCEEESAEQRMAESLLNSGKSLFMPEYSRESILQQSEVLAPLEAIGKAGAEKVETKKAEVLEELFFTEAGFSRQDMLDRKLGKEIKAREETLKKSDQEKLDKIRTSRAKREKDTGSYIIVLHTPAGQTVYFADTARTDVMDALRGSYGENITVRNTSEYKAARAELTPTLSGDNFIVPALPYATHLYFHQDKKSKKSVIEPTYKAIIPGVRNRDEREKETILFNDLVRYCEAIQAQVNKEIGYEGYGNIRTIDGFNLFITPEEIKIMEGSVQRFRIYIDENGSVRSENTSNSLNAGKAYAIYKPLISTPLRHINANSIDALKNEISNIMTGFFEKEGEVVFEQEKDEESEGNYFGERETRATQEEANIPILSDCVASATMRGEMPEGFTLPRAVIYKYLKENGMETEANAVAKGVVIINLTGTESHGSGKMTFPKEDIAALAAKYVAPLIDKAIMAKAYQMESSKLENEVLGRLMEDKVRSYAKANGMSMERIQELIDSDKAGESLSPVAFLTEDDYNKADRIATFKMKDRVIDLEEAKAIIGKAVIGNIERKCMMDAEKEAVKELMKQSTSMKFSIGRYGTVVDIPWSYRKNAEMEMAEESAAALENSAQEAAKEQKNAKPVKVNQQTYSNVAHQFIHKNAKNGTVIVRQKLSNDEYGDRYALQRGGRIITITREAGKDGAPDKIVNSGWYDRIDPFVTADICRAEKDGKMMLLDKDGQIIRHPKSKNTVGSPISGPMSVINEFQVGYTNNDGNDFFYATFINERGLMGMVNEKGNICVEPRYDSISIASNGLAKVTKPDGSMNYIDIRPSATMDMKKNGYRHLFKNDKEYVSDFDNGFAVVKDSKGWIVIDSDRYPCNDPALKIEDFKDGVAIAHYSDGLMYIDNTGGLYDFRGKEAPSIQEFHSIKSQLHNLNSEELFPDTTKNRKP